MIICTLKQYMELENINQSTLSEYTKISRPTLLQLIRNENQNIKYDTIDELCNFFKIEMSELLLYSPMNYKFISYKYERKVNEEIKKLDVKEYFDNYFDLNISIDNTVYNFKFIIGDIDIYEDGDLFLWCSIEKEEYEDLLKRGHSKTFFNTFCELVIKEKITNQTPPLKVLNNYNLTVEFTIKNSPDYDEITADLKYLPTDDLISVRNYLNSLLENNDKED